MHFDAVGLLAPGEDRRGLAPRAVNAHAQIVKDRRRRGQPLPLGSLVQIRAAISSRAVRLRSPDELVAIGQTFTAT